MYSRGEPSAHRRLEIRRRKKRVIFLLVAIAIVIGVGAVSYLFWQRSQPGVTQNVSSTNEHTSASLPSEDHVPPPKEPDTPPVASKPDVTIPPIENGLAPVISTLPTEQPVVFLGIDDGAYKNPSELALMKQHNIKASLFLTYDVIADNPSFFKDFVTAGSLVENHTMTHSHLSTLSYDQQKWEICTQADTMQELYGRRPIFLRPPGGHYNIETRRAAADCGMKAIVMWIAKANGGSMQYQIGNGLRPGDIVLMHFRPEFQQDMQAFVDAMNAAGLHTESLHDWL